MIAKPIAIEWDPGMPIFASEPFLRRAAAEYGWLGGVDEQGTVLCILPYTIIRKAIFRIVRFRVETIQVGVGVTVNEERAFLNAAIEYFRSIGADLVMPPTTNAVFRTFPDGADAAPYGTYVVDLAPLEDTVWANVQARNRGKIRSAMKAGVEIREGLNDLGAVHSLMKTTLKRSGLGLMRLEEFEGYVASFGENIKIYRAHYNGEMQACTVVPFSEYCGYYVYGGSVDKPANGAVSLLHWEAMRRLRELGVKKYDFVGVRIDPAKGSKQEGLMLFKQRFGGTLVQGYLWKYSLHRLAFAAYELAVRFQRGGDIVDAERHKLASARAIQPISPSR